MNTKVPVNPAVIIACLIGLTWLILMWLRFGVSIESVSPESSVPTTETRTSIVNATSSTVKPTKLVEPATLPTRLTQADLGLRQGALRVSNQTNQPVRLALLARRSAPAPSGQTYNSPAHWDFAPQEGSGQGLVLSLPDGSLKLKSGDILVAFAQDGSRRYWGPFVVGETALPVWNNQTEEWQLILK